MGPFAIASIVMVLSFAAAVVGMTLHAKVADRHLDSGVQDVVKLVMGLIATMAALVLSLLIASASSSYDRQSSELKTLASNIILLDRTLEQYGPDAKAARDVIREAVQQTHDRVWSADGVRPEELNSLGTRDSVRPIPQQLMSLAPKTDLERTLQSHAIQQSESITQSRLLLFEQLGSAISWPFLTVLVFWICMLFLGFGMFARFDPVATIALLVGSLSVAGAIFLILELGDPYGGIMRISDAPLRNAMAQIDQ